MFWAYNPDPLWALLRCEEPQRVLRHPLNALQVLSRSGGYPLQTWKAPASNLEGTRSVFCEYLQRVPSRPATGTLRAKCGQLPDPLQVHSRPTAGLEGTLAKDPQNTLRYSLGPLRISVPAAGSQRVWRAHEAYFGLPEVGLVGTPSRSAFAFYYYYYYDY